MRLRPGGPVARHDVVRAETLTFRAGQWLNAYTRRMRTRSVVPALVPLLLALASGGAQASDPSVIDEKVVPGALTVSIYPHSLTTQSGPLSVWTFVSKGLWARHQKELRITVKREPKEAVGDYPRDLLMLYRTIYELAGQGRLVDVGGRTRLGNSGPGLLGRDEFRCLLYTPPQGFDGVPLDTPSLTGLIVTCNEADAAARFGLTRVMARLGRAERFYPTTPWADRKRPELIGAKGNDGSVLAKVNRVAVAAAHVRREHGDKIVLTLLPEGRDAIRSILKRAPDGGFALLVTVDPRADACLVWEPGQERPEGIAAPGSRGEWIAGNFLVLTAGGTRDSSTMAEDGFALIFTTASWKLVRDALERGKPLSLPKPMGGFEIAWLPTDYTDPVSGGTHHPEGWNLYLPQGPPPAADGPVAGDQVVLLMPEDEIAARISTDVLGAFIKQIEAAVSAEVAVTPVEGKVALLVDYTADEQLKQAFRLAFQQDPPRPFADRLQQRLDALPQPPIKKGPIHFQVHYRINAAATVSPRSNSSTR